MSYYHISLQFVATIIMQNVVSYGFLMLLHTGVAPVVHRRVCQFAGIVSNVAITEIMTLTCSYHKQEVLVIVEIHQS